MTKTPKNRCREEGFSLIELMIVIAIIGILISVGVYGWRVAIRKGNEAAAIETVQRIHQAEVSYALGHHQEFGTFDQLIADGSLDEKFKGNNPLVNGYIYTLKVTPKSQTQPSNFSINADPQTTDGIA